MAVFLPGKSLGQRSLAGYSPWGHKRFGHDLVTKQQHNREKLCIIIAGMGFPGGSEVKASARNVGDLGSIPVSGRSPGEGNGNPLQYSCLENSMDRRAWWATVHGVSKSRTQLEVT